MGRVQRRCCRDTQPSWRVGASLWAWTSSGAAFLSAGRCQVLNREDEACPMRTRTWGPQLVHNSSEWSSNLRGSTHILSIQVLWFRIHTRYGSWNQSTPNGRLRTCEYLENARRRASTAELSTREGIQCDPREVENHIFESSRLFRF